MPQTVEVIVWSEGTQGVLTLSWSCRIPDPRHEPNEALPGQPEPQCNVMFSDLWSIGLFMLEVPMYYGSHRHCYSISYSGFPLNTSNRVDPELFKNVGTGN